MVTEVPTPDEMLAWEDEDFQTGRVDVDDTMEQDEQLLYVALYTILSFLYLDFQHKGHDYVLKHFPKAADEAGEKLLNYGNSDLTRITEDYRRKILLEHKIPLQNHPLVRLDFDPKNTQTILKSSLESVIHQLKDDVKTKAQIARAGAIQKEKFSIKANFKRAVRRVKNTVKYTVQINKQKVERAVQKMRYGADMLYYWVVARINTCKDCYDLAKLPPKPMGEWPLDHVNGRCKLVPVSEESTKEYLSYLGEYSDITVVDELT